MPFGTLILVLVATLLYLISCMSRKGSHLIINWPIYGMLPSIIANHNHLLDHATSMLREFNHIIIFQGPWLCNMNFLLTCDPDNANHMFNLHFANYPKGDGVLEIFDVLGEGIFNVDGDSWVAQRKKAQAHMIQHRFKTSVGERTKAKIANVLLPLLSDLAEGGEIVDFSDILIRFTFDTTCHLVLGVDPGCLAPEFPSITFAKAIENVEEVILNRHIVLMTWWKLMRMLKLGKEKMMDEERQVIDRYLRDRIRERRKNMMNNSDPRDDGCNDMMSLYMEDSGDKFLRDTVLTFMAAGKDTTGAALVWLFWLIANNPDVERKFLQELREICTNKNTQTPPDNELIVFDIEEIDRLIYLHAVVCETLRLYPSIPFNHKEAVKADVLPSGHKVSPGIKIIFCMYAMGRMEGIWGKDCLEFKPERWITDKGTLRHEPSYKFIAFHSGPRSCLGKGMSITQIKLLAAAVLYNFEVKTVEGHVTEPRPSIVIQAKNGLPVRLKKRKVKDW